MPENPPSTRLEIGHEVNCASRSTSTTSIAGPQRRMYLAAVAPPKPPPTITTRALDGTGVRQPARPASELAPAVAPASFRNSRLFMAYLFCAENQAASASIC